MNANDKFQLWSPPKLDLSLDSFSDDLLQQFDNKRRQNVTVTPTETLVSSPIQQQKEDYLPQTPISSSLISDQEQYQPDDKEEEEQVQEDDEENGEEGEKEDDDDNDDHEFGEEEAEIEGKGDIEENQGESDEENNENEQVEEDENEVVEGAHSSTNVFRKSSSFLKKRLSQNIGSPVKEDEEQQQQEQKPREVINSKVAPPDIKATSVPEQPPVTPKRRSFFSFRFC